jgi:hypothetical protein
VVTEPKTTVVTDSPTTVVIRPSTTVVDNLLSAAVSAEVPNAGEKQPMWVAEYNGALFPASRIRPVEKAQDALTHAEESVYDFLWGPKNSAKDDYRIAQAGYDRIAKAARITKRNAALIVERLIEKGFVTLESESDPLHRIPRRYRVLGYRSALDELARRGRNWVVRSGNGVLFVRPATVVVDPQTTVVADKSTTVVAATTVTVVADQPTTVVAATTLLDNKKETERQSSSALADVCRKYGILLDAAADRVIQKRCRTYDSAASPEEMAYFAEAKINQLRQSRNVGNLVGLLMTAIPEYFVQPAHELQRYREKKAQDLAKGRELALKILNDTDASEQEREWAEGVLSADSGCR